MRPQEASRTDAEAAANLEGPVKGKLYRTAVSAGLVLVLLEGLGAGWKWG